MSEYIPLSVPQPTVQLWQQLSSLAAVTFAPTDISAWPQALIGVINGRTAQAAMLCFVDRQPSAEQLTNLAGAIVLTNAELAPSLLGAFCVVTADPRALFIDWVNQGLAQERFSAVSSLAEMAGVSTAAIIAPTAVIEDGVSIAAGASIAAGCVIKRGTVIGANTIVRENTVIGCPGIALYRCQDGRVLRFPHLAGVHIGENTEIGANSVIPRGAMSSTKIGSDVVIGNLCNIGHGAQIGDKVWMSVGSLIGGNTAIGKGVTIGMSVVVRDNLVVGDAATLGMGSVIVKDVESETSMFGNPAKRMPSLSAGPDR